MPKQLTSGASVPSKNRVQILVALNAVAALHDGDPAAIAGMVNTESAWNTTSVTGKYIGLTQVGPEIPKLLGIDAQEFLLLSAAKQIKAYGTWLDYYKFTSKMQKDGIDVAGMQLSRQAAVLQAMQFAPNGKKWKVALSKGDFTAKSTPSKQAKVLGNTSIGDMEKYYTTFFTKHPPKYA